MQKDGDDYISSSQWRQLYLLYHAKTNLVHLTPVMLTCI